MSHSSSHFFMNVHSAFSLFLHQGVGDKDDTIFTPARVCSQVLTVTSREITVYEGERELEREISTDRNQYCIQLQYLGLLRFFFFFFGKCELLIPIFFLNWYQQVSVFTDNKCVLQPNIFILITSYYEHFPNLRPLSSSKTKKKLF